MLHSPPSVLSLLHNRDRVARVPQGLQRASLHNLDDVGSIAHRAMLHDGGECCANDQANFSGRPSFDTVDVEFLKLRVSSFYFLVDFRWSHSARWDARVL